MAIEDAEEHARARVGREAGLGVRVLDWVVGLESVHVVGLDGLQAVAVVCVLILAQNDTHLRNKLYISFRLAQLKLLVRRKEVRIRPLVV